MPAPSGPTAARGRSRCTGSGSVPVELVVAVEVTGVAVEPAVHRLLQRAVDTADPVDGPGAGLGVEQAHSQAPGPAVREAELVDADRAVEVGPGLHRAGELRPLVAAG